jgi:hypothetical protein
MWAAETLTGWHDFYLLVGTAGATLLGLLFIAVSLGAGYLTKERQSGIRTFMSPVVIHFTSVFFLSAIALFPSHQARFFAALIGGTALIGSRRAQDRESVSQGAGTRTDSRTAEEKGEVHLAPAPR